MCKLYVTYCYIYILLSVCFYISGTTVLSHYVIYNQIRNKANRPLFLYSQYGL